MVTFKYTDTKTGQIKIVTVDVMEFIRRFLQHVLPHNFMKVRYYGFLAAASRNKLNKIRKLLFLEVVQDSKKEKTKSEPKTIHCPKCDSPMQWVEDLPRGFKDHVP